MATTEKVAELNLRTFQGAFANRSHDMWAYYDKVMDELIVSLARPGTPVAEFYLDDMRAFLVKDNSDEVVGFLIANFEQEWLSNWPQLRDLWTSHVKPFLSERKKLKYVPEIVKPKASTGKVAEAMINVMAFENKAFAQQQALNPAS